MGQAYFYLAMACNSPCPPRPSFFFMCGDGYHLDPLEAAHGDFAAEHREDGPGDQEKGGGGGSIRRNGRARARLIVCVFFDGTFFGVGLKGNEEANHHFVGRLDMHINYVFENTCVVRWFRLGVS